MPNLLKNLEVAFLDKNEYNIDPDFIPAWFNIDYCKPIDLSLYSLGDLQDKQITFSNKCYPRKLEYFNTKIKNIEIKTDVDLQDNKIYYIDSNGNRVESTNYNTYKINQDKSPAIVQQQSDTTNVNNITNLQKLIKNQYDEFFNNINIIKNNEIYNEIEILHNNYIEILKTNIQNIYTYVDKNIIDLEIKQNVYIQNISEEITNNLINYFNNQYHKQITLLEKRNVNNTLNILKS